MHLFCTSPRSCCGGGGEDNGHNQSVETERLSENENEDHSNVDVFLGVGAHTGITDNSNAKAGSEGGETAAKTTGQVLVAEVGGVVGLDDAVSVGSVTGGGEGN